MVQSEADPVRSIRCLNRVGIERPLRLRGPCESPVVFTVPRTSDNHVLGSTLERWGTGGGHGFNKKHNRVDSFIPFSFGQRMDHSSERGGPFPCKPSIDFTDSVSIRSPRRTEGRSPSEFTLTLPGVGARITISVYLPESKYFRFRSVRLLPRTPSVIPARPRSEGNLQGTEWWKRGRSPSCKRLLIRVYVGKVSTGSSTFSSQCDRNMGDSGVGPTSVYPPTLLEVRTSPRLQSSPWTKCCVDPIRFRTDPDPL